MDFSPHMILVLQNQTSLLELSDISYEDPYLDQSLLNIVSLDPVHSLLSRCFTSLRLHVLSIHRDLTNHELAARFRLRMLVHKMRGTLQRVLRRPRLYRLFTRLRDELVTLSE